MIPSPSSSAVGRAAFILWGGTSGCTSPVGSLGFSVIGGSTVMPPTVVRNFVQDPEVKRPLHQPQSGPRLCGSVPVAMLVVGARSARALFRRSLSTRVDSHLHLWTPDTAKYPTDNPPPLNLNFDRRATHESFVRTMDDVGIAHAVVVQPINYWQDYRYLIDAMNAHPVRIKGVFIADPGAGTPEACVQHLERTASSHANWAGVRFNPYKWPTTGGVGMADEVGVAMFRRAGELGLTVGFMPFKGLSNHVVEIESLIQASPSTRVVIDHWGFFLQPATGSGERCIDEKSWRCLLHLARHAQVFVKVSALFRVATDQWPYVSLSERLRELITVFGADRLMLGSDFPFCTEHGDYGKVMKALENLPVWQEISDAERGAILGGSALRVFRFYPASSSPA